MSVGYVAVQWTRSKKVYDQVILGGVGLYLLTFLGIGKVVWRHERAISDEILLIRATATCALLMLHVVLCIGPLARLSPRFLPLLYNRRHLGVATFLVALTHAILVLGYYHGFGHVNPLVSLLTHDVDWRTASSLPFQILGLGGLMILFLMAATSHDFWLKNLSPRVWKSIHMLIYPAYGLIVMHVVLGALQTERSPVYALLVVLGAGTVMTLHLVAAFRERACNRRSPRTAEKSDDGRWIDAGPPADITENRAIVICPEGGERIAVFRYGGRISAVRSMCAHQGGPLGEGKIIDGCITCPWHGWQYRPQDGQSPPPFTEKIPTHRVKLMDGRVWVDPTPLPPGTPTPPACMEECHHA